MTASLTKAHIASISTTPHEIRGSSCKTCTCGNKKDKRNNLREGEREREEREEREREIFYVTTAGSHSLFVFRSTETMPQLVALSETYIQIYALQNQE